MPTSTTRPDGAVVALVLAGLLLVAAIPAGAVAVPSSATELTGCATISTPGQYVLTQNVSVSGVPNCLYVESSDVVVDGNGYAIDGQGTPGNAVEVDGPGGAVDNVTVRNLTVRNWETGVDVDQTSNATVRALTVRDVERGVRAFDTDVGLVVADVDVERASSVGVLVEDSIRVRVTNNRVADVGTVSAPGVGIDLNASTGRVLSNQVATVEGTGIRATDWTWPGARIRYNDVADVSGDGIRASSGGSLNVIGNTVQRVGAAAIRVENGGGTRIDANTVTDVDQSDGGTPGVVVADTWTIVSDNDVQVAGDTTAFHVSDSEVSFSGDAIDGQYGIVLDVSNATMAGLDLRGHVGVEATASNVQASGIDYWGGNAFRVFNGETSINDSAFESTSGVYAFGGTVTVDNTSMTGGHTGVSLDSGASGTVTNSSINTSSTTVQTEAIEVQEDGDATLRNVLVRDANVGILVEAGTNVTVEDARFESVGVAVDATTSNVSLSNVTKTGGGHVAWVESTTLTATNVTASDLSVAFRLLSSTATIADASLSGSGSNSGLGAYVFYTDLAIGDATVAGFETGLESDADSTVTARNVSVDASGVGLLADRGGSFGVVESTVTAGDVGVRVEDEGSAAVLRNSTVDAPLGLDLTADASVANSGVSFVDLGNTTVPIRNNNTTALPAQLSYFGPDGPRDAQGQLRLTDPFLTAPPGAVNPQELQEFGVDLELPAGRVYSLGAPGGMERTLAETFDDFDGAVYLYNGSAQTWELADGTERLDALEAVVVVPTTDARAVVEFRETTPAQPAERTLEPGWQFVAPRSFDTAERGFDTDRTLAAIDLLHLYALPEDFDAGPSSDADLDFTSYEFQRQTLYGDGYANSVQVSPFGGYFVYVTQESTVPARVPDGVTVDELADLLNLDDLAWGYSGF